MIDIFFIILGLALIKYIVVFALPYLIFWKWFPRYFSQTKIQVQERQKPQIPLEIRYSLSTIAIQSALFFSFYYLAQIGVFSFSTSWFSWRGLAQPSISSEIIAAIFYFVIYDTYFYWSHRLLHQGWFYKKIHVVHHMSLNPTPFASYSFHPIEAIISMLYFYPVLYFFPMSVELFLLLIVLTDIGNLGGHLGYDLVPKAMWKNQWGSWLTTPTHHNMHHQYSKCNYGLYWRGWDNIFKTLHAKTEEEFYRVKNQ